MQNTGITILFSQSQGNMGKQIDDKILTGHPEVGEKMNSSSSEDLILIMISKKETKRMWAHPPLFPLSRDREKEFHLLLEELKLNHGRFLMYFRTSAGHHFNLCLVCQDLVLSDSDHEAVVGDRHGIHDWLMHFFAV